MSTLPTTVVQNPPTGEGTVVVDLVVADMKARKEFGIAKYGTPLRTRNGRSFLWDAYQEALDLAIYLRGLIEEEEEGKQP